MPWAGPATEKPLICWCVPCHLLLPREVLYYSVTRQRRAKNWIVAGVPVLSASKTLTWVIFSGIVKQTDKTPGEHGCAPSTNFSDSLISRPFLISTRTILMQKSNKQKSKSKELKLRLFLLEVSLSLLLFMFLWPWMYLSPSWLGVILQDGFYSFLSKTSRWPLLWAFSKSPHVR